MTRNTIPLKAGRAEGRGGGLPAGSGGRSPGASPASPAGRTGGHVGAPMASRAEGSPPGVDTLLTALETVRDPELDEPITSLGFVASCTVSAAGDAQVRLRQRRAELGLPSGDGAPLLIDPVTGAQVNGDAMPLHLRRARTTRISIEANGGICRGMLRHRYDSEGLGEEENSEGRPDTWLSPATRR